MSREHGSDKPQDAAAKDSPAALGPNGAIAGIGAARAEVKDSIGDGKHSTAGKEALDAALDWTKVSTGVAAGALVFAIGLLSGSATYTNCVRVGLLVGWIALGLAILAGIVAQSAIPVMIADENYNLEYGPFVWPARLHQLSWLVGVVAIAFSLQRIMFGSPAINLLKVSDAGAAVDKAIGQVPRGRHIEKTAVIEQIKGADPSDPVMARWHLQFLLTPTAKEQQGRLQQSVDVIVDPGSSKAQTWVR